MLATRATTLPPARLAPSAVLERERLLILLLLPMLPVLSSLLLLAPSPALVVAKSVVLLYPSASTARPDFT
jgi:hypothetical protein